MGLLRATLVSLAAVTSAASVPNASFKRQVSQLRPSYDFVVVGGGTSGLTVANRLTEALSSSKFKLSDPSSKKKKSHSGPGFYIYHVMADTFSKNK